MTAAAFNSDRVIVVRRIPRFIFPQLKKRKSKVLLSKRFDSVLSNRRLKRPIKLTGDTYMKNDGISNICLVYGYWLLLCVYHCSAKMLILLDFLVQIINFFNDFSVISDYGGTINFFCQFSKDFALFLGEISVLAVGCYKSDREFDENNHQFTIYWNRQQLRLRIPRTDGRIERFDSNTFQNK